MEENNTNQTEILTQEVTDDLTPVTTMEAITGVITEPSYTFENISQNKPRHYWVFPVIIFIVANIISMLLFYSDTELYSSVMDKQRKSMEERFDKSIKEGKMTQEQKSIAMETAEKFMNPKSPFAIAIAIGASVIGPFIIMVLVSVIYLLCFKIIKAEIVFTNILNVVGLTFIISSIAKILETVLSIITGKLTNFSPGFLFPEESFGSSISALISKVDVFSLWALIVTAIGLTLIGKVKSKAMYFFVFGLWLIWSLISAFLLPSQ